MRRLTAQLLSQLLVADSDDEGHPSMVSHRVASSGAAGTTSVVAEASSASQRQIHRCVGQREGGSPLPPWLQDQT